MMSTEDATRVRVGDRVAIAPREHYIEEAVRVYLMLSEDRTEWVLDPATFDQSLFSDYENGPVRANCECGDDPLCQAVTDEAAKIGMPTWESLVVQYLRLVSSGDDEDTVAQVIDRLTDGASA